jgi:chromosome segregation ATPase
MELSGKSEEIGELTRKLEMAKSVLEKEAAKNEEEALRARDQLESKKVELEKALDDYELAKSERYELSRQFAEVSAVLKQLEKANIDLECETKKNVEEAQKAKVLLDLKAVQLEKALDDHEVIKRERDELLLEFEEVNTLLKQVENVKCDLLKKAAKNAEEAQIAKIELESQAVELEKALDDHILTKQERDKLSNKFEEVTLLLKQLEHAKSDMEKEAAKNAEEAQRAKNELESKAVELENALDDHILTKKERDELLSRFDEVSMLLKQLEKDKSDLEKEAKNQGEESQIAKEELQLKVVELEKALDDHKVTKRERDELSSKFEEVSTLLNHLEKTKSDLECETHKQESEVQKSRADLETMAAELKSAFNETKETKLQRDGMSEKLDVVTREADTLRQSSIESYALLSAKFQDLAGKINVEFPLTNGTPDEEGLFVHAIDKISEKYAETIREMEKNIEDLRQTGDEASIGLRGKLKSVEAALESSKASLKESESALEKAESEKDTQRERDQKDLDQKMISNKKELQDAMRKASETEQELRNRLMEKEEVEAALKEEAAKLESSAKEELESKDTLMSDLKKEINKSRDSEETLAIEIQELKRRMEDGESETNGAKQRLDLEVKELNKRLSAESEEARRSVEKASVEKEELDRQGWDTTNLKIFLC